MSVEFVLQGFTDSSHADVIRDMFAIDGVESGLIAVAFVNERGVDLVRSSLEACKDNLRVFVGVRNEVTTYQGLLALFEVCGDLYVIDTGSRGVLFHPKLCVVRNNRTANLLVGSANLTGGGLSRNVEAGLLLRYDITTPESERLVRSIEENILSSVAEYPDNILRMGSIDDVNELLKKGLVVDESVKRLPRLTGNASTRSADNTPIIVLKNKTIKIKPKKSVGGLGVGQGESENVVSTVLGVDGDINGPVSDLDYELMWESKPLTRRDLTIPTGLQTNQTGSINLDKGLLFEDIDHRHYFREEVFQFLIWDTSRNSTVDEAIAEFSLGIKGVDYGNHTLTIHHTTSTSSPAYIQRNAMTRLSWGEVRQYIAKEDLIGRKLSLYRNKASKRLFMIEID